MIRSLRHTLLALLIVGATTVALGAAPAASAAPAAARKAPPCWKVLLNDWFDGRIDGTYEIHCYREALSHLPADVDTYSSARDDIRQALQKRITQGHGGGAAAGSGGGSGGGAAGGGSGGGGSGSGGSAGGGSADGGNSSAEGPIPDAINNLGPKKADSLPVPLLVLGGVAIVLMAAGGAGFVARRTRLRKVQAASAASVPHGPGPGPHDQP
ncbi:MAG TPA: hypothetical protein VH760_10025 [Gaiellaceae bacterium]